MIKTSRFIVALGLLALAYVPALLTAQEGPTAHGAPDPGLAAGHVKELAIKVLQSKSGSQLVVTSPAFKDGADIPYENTQYRGNIFPGLTWTKGPAGTRSYAVFVQGQSESSQGPGTSIHLVLFNIPASVTSLRPGTEPPEGSVYGPNIRGPHSAYAGPHTHTFNKNDHHYQVFALDTVLPADLIIYPEPLMAQMSAHVLASGDLVGVSARDPNATDADASPWLNPIKIKTGFLTGTCGRDPSITVYKGIPYVAAPIGDLRWKLPQPATPWQGVRAADHFGANCPDSPRKPVSEDCLFLPTCGRKVPPLPPILRGRCLSGMKAPAITPQPPRSMESPWSKKAWL